ncbi:MAG TPA: undecaprenyl-phosphate glucose phosphotransferase, partial [Myxococcaceae bacterium]|nr:undecaprenyl-phosphate glucose phosphotransferase [Myxococcaceae bacterium]
MFSRFQRFYTSIKVVADMAMLTLAFVLAYVTRFDGPIPVYYGLPPLDETLVSLGTVLLVFPLTYRQAHLYTTNRSRTHIGEVFEVFKATITATLLVVALTYFTRERYSRLMLAFFSGYAFVGVSLMRLLLRAVLNEVR